MRYKIAFAVYIIIGLFLICLSIFNKESDTFDQVQRIIAALVGIVILIKAIEVKKQALKEKRFEVEYSLIENKQWDEAFESISSIDSLNIEAKLFLKENYSITKK